MTARPKDVLNQTPNPALAQAGAAHGALRLTDISVQFDDGDAVVTVVARGPVPMRGSETSPAPGAETKLWRSAPLEWHLVHELAHALDRLVRDYAHVDGTGAAF